MLAAAYRQPPFSKGEKEKGFRDALIAEAVVQLVTASPVTPKVCRIALVTGDGLLTEAITARTTKASNVRILPSIEELKGLINTLVSEVDEAFIKQVQEAATTYFFKAGQEDTLLFKENILDKISDKFGQIIFSVPPGADTQEHVKTSVTPPQFVKKEGQRIFWASRIIMEAVAYKYEPASPSQEFPKAVMIGQDYPASRLLITGSEHPSLNPELPIGGYFAGSMGFRPGQSGLISLIPPRTKSKVMTGRFVVEVVWSVVVSTTRRNFSRPRIESIEYVETLWE